MSDVIITPLMNLPNPVPSADPGPDYATNLSNSLNIIDGHNHSIGSGNQINSGGIVVNGDIPFNGYNETLLRSVRFTPQASPLALPSDLGCLYEAGIDLYYNDGNGNQVRITSGGNVNATSSGISSGTANAAFSSSVLVVNADTNTPANIQCASVLLGNNVAASNFLTLSPPNAMSVNFGLVLPSLPAASGSGLQIDTSGNITSVPYPFVPTGVLLPYGGGSAPNGFLLCDGSAVSRSTYSALFAVVGTSFGIGDGSTTFNVPNTARRVPMGAGGSGTATITNTVGGTGGEENHTLTIPEIPSHAHSITLNNVTISNQATSLQGTATQTGTGSTSSIGGGGGHNTIQPSLITNYIIKI